MQDNVALITGCSSGIGRDLAFSLGKRGYAIAALARRKPLLDELVNDLRAKGIDARAYAVDVADAQQMKSVVDTIEQEQGQLKLLVANAGVAGDIPAYRFDAAKARQIYEVNVIGLMNSVAACLPLFRKRQAGAIVGISSIAGYLSVPRNSVYSSSKAAVTNFLEGLRLEVQDKGIQVTTVCPGFIKTAMVDGVRFSMPMIMSSEKAAEKIANAIEKGKSVYRFPLPLYWGARLVQCLPFFIRKKVLG